MCYVSGGDIHTQNSTGPVCLRCGVGMAAVHIRANCMCGDRGDAAWRVCVPRGDKYIPPLCSPQNYTRWVLELHLVWRWGGCLCMLAVAICVTACPMPALEKITFLSDNFIFFLYAEGGMSSKRYWSLWPWNILLTKVISHRMSS